VFNIHLFEGVKVNGHIALIKIDLNNLIRIKILYLRSLQMYIVLLHFANLYLFYINNEI